MAARREQDRFPERFDLRLATADLKGLHRLAEERGMSAASVLRTLLRRELAESGRGQSKRR